MGGRAIPTGMHYLTNDEFVNMCAGAVPKKLTFQEEMENLANEYIKKLNDLIKKHS